MKYNVGIGYKFDGGRESMVLTVTADSEREAFYAAQRELRHRLIDAAIWAADHSWAVTYERVERGGR